MGPTSRFSSSLPGILHFDFVPVPSVAKGECECRHSKALWGSECSDCGVLWAKGRRRGGGLTSLSTYPFSSYPLLVSYVCDLPPAILNASCLPLGCLMYFLRHHTTSMTWCLFGYDGARPGKSCPLFLHPKLPSFRDLPHPFPYSATLFPSGGRGDTPKPLKCNTTMKHRRVEKLRKEGLNILSFPFSPFLFNLIF